MDEYGIFTATVEDWDAIAHHLNDFGSVTFPYSHDRATCYIVSIAFPHKVGGPLPWGGSITGMHLVSLRRFGAEFFSLMSKQKFSSEYIGEKLNLQIGDAIPIAQLLNALSERMST